VLDLHVAVRWTDRWASWKNGKRSAGSGNRALLSTSQTAADLLAVVPWTRVSRRRPPSADMPVLLRQAGEAVSLQAVGLDEVHADSTLPLCLGVYGLVGTIAQP